MPLDKIHNIFYQLLSLNFKMRWYEIRWYHFLFWNNTIHVSKPSPCNFSSLSIFCISNVFPRRCVMSSRRSSAWRTWWTSGSQSWGMGRCWSGWWLDGGFKYFWFFTPTWGRFPFWLIFFQMGWNHQLDEDVKMWQQCRCGRFFFGKDRQNL